MPKISSIKPSLLNNIWTILNYYHGHTVFIIQREVLQVSL